MNARIGRPKTTQKTIVGAYIRMSTGQQFDSPAKQREMLTLAAARQDYEIRYWYDDAAKTGTKSDNRKDFQRMLADAKAGKFEVLLVWEVSRASREDPLDAAVHAAKLRDAGVVLETTGGQRMDFRTESGQLQWFVMQQMAHQESKRNSDRCTGGQRRAVARGQRIGGIPFGYDREIVDRAGNVVMTISFRDNQCKPHGMSSRLIPSKETAAVDVVRFIFNGIANGRTVRGLVQDLQKQTACPPRKKVWRNGKPPVNDAWEAPAVYSILRNAVYCGDHVLGARKIRGRFNRIVEGKEVRHGTHEAIITRELFEKVQSLMRVRRQPRGKSREGAKLLVGVAHCAHCGQELLSHVQGGRSDRTVCRSVFYQAQKCEHPTTVRVEFEAAIVRTVCDALQTEDVLRDLQKASQRQAKQEQADPLKSQRDCLAMLTANIKRAGANFALAESDELRQAINEQVAAWREEAQAIEAELSKQDTTATLTQESRASLRQMLALLRTIAVERLTNEDRIKLDHLLRLVLADVRLGVARRIEGRLPELFVDVEFRPGVLPVGVNQVVRVDLAHKFKYQSVVDEVIRAYPRVFRIRDLMGNPELKALGSDEARSTMVSRALRRAVDFGKLVEVERGHFQAVR